MALLVGACRYARQPQAVQASPKTWSRYGLLVHAESEQARGFYEHLLKDIRRTLRR
jgi:hypothetical protein